MSWWQALPVFIAVLGVFFVPGVLVVLAARLRGLVILAAAPAVSLGIAGVGAIFASIIGMDWNVGTFLLCALVVLVAVFLVCRGQDKVTETVSADSRIVARWLPVIGGLGVAIPMGFFPIKAGMAEPHFPALTWDSIYHHSAVRWILETGNGSSLELGAVASDQGIPSYYPAAWHDMVSMTVMGLPISVSINMTAILMSVVIWPFAMAYLAQTIFPKYPIVVFLTPILASGFVAFPARMISYGTVWPAAMGTALVPVLLGLTIAFFRAARRSKMRRHLLIVILMAAAGAGLCHPTAVIAWVYLATPFVATRYFPFVLQAVRSDRRRLAALSIGGPVLAVIFVAIAISTIPRLKSVFTFQTSPVAIGPTAFGNAIFDTMLAPLGHGNTDPYWVVGFLSLIGLVLTFVRGERRWVSGSYAISIALYVIAAEGETFLRPLVGLWYSDPVRLGGLVPIMTSVLAAYALHLGLTLVARWFPGGFRHNSCGERVGFSTPTRVIAAVGVLLLTALLFPITDNFRADVRQQRIASDYWKHLQWEGGIASAEEIKFLRDLDEELPQDAVVLGDPTSGAALIYSMSKRDVVFPTLSGRWSDKARYLGRNFNHLESDPRICQILTDMGVTHFYDDDGRYLPNIIHRKDMTGLTTIGIPDNDLRLIDEADGARIYKITACGL